MELLRNNASREPLTIFSSLSQSPILKRYPAPLSETALSMFFGWIFLVVTGLLVVQDTSAWVVTNGLCILSIVYAVRAPGLSIRYEVYFCFVPNQIWPCNRAFGSVM